MARSKKFDDLLIESLKDPNEALAYLTVVFEEYKDGDEESLAVLQRALQYVAKAYKVSKKPCHIKKR